MMLRATRICGAVLVGCLAGSARPADAAVILTTGAGSAVTQADREATFDSITAGAPLANYAEDGIRVSVQGVAFLGFDPTGGNGGFSGAFHYPSGGADGATIISTTDALPFYAVEFNVGTGYLGTATTFFRYEARSGGSILGSGVLTVPSGTVLGIRSDGIGIDQLFVGTYSSFALAQAANNGSFQAIALDKLRLQLTSSGVIPEPSALALLGIGTAGLLGVGWRRRLRVGAPD